MRESTADSLQLTASEKRKDNAETRRTLRNAEKEKEEDSPQRAPSTQRKRPQEHRRECLCH
jgi:hypothetical protein